MFIDSRSHSIPAPDGAKCDASHFAPVGAQAISQSKYYKHSAPLGLWTRNPEHHQFSISRSHSREHTVKERKSLPYFPLLFSDSQFKSFR
jgi:hypothetical protein